MFLHTFKKKYIKKLKTQKYMPDEHFKFLGLGVLNYNFFVKN